MPAKTSLTSTKPLQSTSDCEQPGTVKSVQVLPIIWLIISLISPIRLTIDKPLGGRVLGSILIVLVGAAIGPSDVGGLFDMIRAGGPSDVIPAGGPSDVIPAGGPSDVIPAGGPSDLVTSQTFPIRSESLSA